MTPEKAALVRKVAPLLYALQDEGLRLEREERAAANPSSGDGASSDPGSVVDTGRGDFSGEAA